MRSLVLVLLLASAPLALAPTAAAHTCVADNGPRDCGDCGGTAPHDHRSRDGSWSCWSSGSGPTYVCVDVNGQKEVCVTIDAAAPLDLPGQREIRVLHGVETPALFEAKGLP